MTKCDCSDQRHYFKHHADYLYWLDQRGKTVRITRGAFRGDTGRVVEVCAFVAQIQITRETNVSIHYDDLEVVPRYTSEEPHTCLGYGPCGVPGCIHNGGRHPCCDCPSKPAPLVLTQEDIGKKFLVVRGILKGQEGELVTIFGGTKRVYLRFEEYPHLISARIPVEDLELVD